MNFLEKRKNQLGIKSLGDLRREGKVSGGINPALFVHGPELFDLLVNKWARAEVMGVVGDSSVGKSELALYFMKGILLNNPKSCAIYVSLEMTNEKIGARWYPMCGNNEHLADQLFPISRYDEDGKSKEISIDFIKKEVIKYRDSIGDVVALCIDHIHVLGENDPSTLNSIMIALKETNSDKNFGSFSLKCQNLN